MHIARYARKVSMVIRGDGLKQTLSQYLVDRILAGPQIEVLPHTEVSALHGDHVSSAITLTNRQTGQQQTFNTRWLFSCLGGVPHTQWAAELGIVRDTESCLVTGPDLRKDSRYPENWPLTRDPTI
jgi:thioredoxin reductase (NADPH)